VSIAARAAKTITWTFDPTVTPDNDIIRERVLLDGWGSFTGKSVSVDKAQGFVPVMAAIRLRAETIGSLPLPIYERLEQGKRVNPDHRLYKMLHDQANPEMTAMIFKETLQSHADAWGTGYAEIEYDTDGVPMWLWPLLASNMEVFREDGTLIFMYTHADGTRSRLSSRQVFRLPGLGSNGITGYSPIHMARQALALGMAAEEYAGRYYSGDARPGVVIKLGPEYDYDDDAKKRLAESFDATHAGLSNKHRTAVLDEGMGIEQIGFNAEDSQLIESQKWSVEQVCRIFNIPPHMLHSLERATFNNIEELGLNFVTYSLRPWLVRWEQQIKMQLLADDVRHFAEFNVEGLLRGKIEDRMKANWSMFQMGAITPNEIRSRENMNHRDDEAGDTFYVPVNIGAVSEEAEAPPVLPPLQLATRSAKALDPKAIDKYEPLMERITRQIIEFERERIMEEAARRFTPEAA
jgi:HK97 family phage portal protein